MTAGANRIRLEHVALNVAEPVKMTQWYVDHLDMQVVREGPAPANTRFLADAGGNMMLELYHNPPEAVPNYAAMDPLILHVAFMVDELSRTIQLAGNADSDGVRLRYLKELRSNAGMVGTSRRDLDTLIVEIERWLDGESLNYFGGQVSRTMDYDFRIPEDLPLYPLTLTAQPQDSGRATSEQTIEVTVQRCRVSFALPPRPACILDIRRQR